MPGIYRKLHKKACNSIPHFICDHRTRIVYLFGYIPHNEKVIRAQRFKVLQDVDTKIENSVALLDNLLTAYEPPTGKEEPVKFDS